MSDTQISVSKISELLHSSLHEIAGSSARIHRIAMLLERSGTDFDPELRSWLCHMANASAQLDASLQAIRRYTEALDLPHERSKVAIVNVIDSVSAGLGVAPRVIGDRVPEIDADRARIALVLKELLENAAKFRRAEPCEIQVEAVIEGDRVVTSVADNGIGIEPQHAERVFKPFCRLWGDRFPGTGMGLAIARMIVEGWNGRIWFEPAQPCGSVFRFTLPE